NTLGAGLGALAMAGSWILGRVGLDRAIHIAAAVNVACGLLALALLSQARGPALDREPQPAAAPGMPGAGRWIALYAFTGFAALGLEVAWFRLLNVVGRSTTYTFSRLIFVYLVGVGLGSLIGSRIAPRVRRPAQAFLWCQMGVGLLALLGPALVVAYFGSVSKLRELPRDVLAPALVLLGPTLLMGLSFPLMQRLVSTQLSTLGRSTGRLLFANTVGCVAGTLVTGFVLLDRLGTPDTLRLLGLGLGALGFIPAWQLLAPRGMRMGAVLGVTAALGVGALALPSGARFWAPLHGKPAAVLTSHEDGACVLAAVEEAPATYNLYISGEKQNGVPFDDFHVRLGTVPALLHPAPRKTLVIGLGAGSTPYGLTLDPRVESVDCVEICPGEVPLLKGLGARGVKEMQELFAEQRIRYHFQDGRKFLLDTRERYDVIVTDTLLTISALSGSLYSREFYELALARLAPGGVFAQWIPSERIFQTAASVFPHTRAVRSPHAQDEAQFLVGSNAPLSDDAAAVLARYWRTRKGGLPAETERRLEAFVSTLTFDPGAASTFGAGELNRDLFPRDEYAGW
ncbi:MAG: spermidine synthase, partial [Myxococcaceae bacterium]